MVCTHGRLERVAGTMMTTVALDADDVTYCAMPLFHSNAVNIAFEWNSGIAQ